jgi:hypothetical protein
MPAVTLIAPDELVARIDAIVEKRKAAARDWVAPRKSLEEAGRIAKAGGSAAANSFLRRLRPRRASRMGVILELVELGLKR